jgi:hypothetical protein
MVALEEIEVKDGDCLPIVVVEDRAYDAVRFIMSAEVEVV